MMLPMSRHDHHDPFLCQEALKIRRRFLYDRERRGLIRIYMSTLSMETTVWTAKLWTS